MNHLSSMYSDQDSPSHPHENKPNLGTSRGIQSQYQPQQYGCHCHQSNSTCETSTGTRRAQKTTSTIRSNAYYLRQCGHENYRGTRMHVKSQNVAKTSSILNYKRKTSPNRSSTVG